MDQEILNTLMTLVVLPLLVGVSGFAVAWLRKKTQEITENIENTTAKKYIDIASEAVAKAVQTTFQTYVDTLKAQGKFDKEAQLAALQKSKDTAAALITDEVKKEILTNGWPPRSKHWYARTKRPRPLPLRRNRHRSQQPRPPLPLR